MTTKLSVNLNKIALLRNSRDGDSPNLIHAAQSAINSGTDGLTLHPRHDQRHARLDDVVMLASLAEIASGAIELNIEGDLRPELIRLAIALRPTQFTVVPVMPGEKTSHRGWRPYDDDCGLRHLRDKLSANTRIAVFCDPHPASVITAANAAKIDAVEIYTGSYADDYDDPARRNQHLDTIAAAAAEGRKRGLRIHAGHDLNLINLPDLFAVTAIDEVSIGHHLTCDALYRGWETVIRDYAALCAAKS